MFIVAAVLLGAIPAVLFAARRLVAPAFVVGVAFVASAARPTPVGPTPFGRYLLGWIALAVVALAAAGGEASTRRWAERRRANAA